MSSQLLKEAYELQDPRSEPVRPFQFPYSDHSVADLNHKKGFSDTSTSLLENEEENGKRIFGTVHVQEASNPTSTLSLGAGVDVAVIDDDTGSNNSEQIYQLYKRRWVGVVALVLLNIIKGCNWVWFGSIANSITKEFHFTLGQVNMLGNIPHISYLLFSWCVPILVRRWGLRWSSVFGASVLFFAAWIRYAGTIKSLSTNGSYALIIIAQLLVGVTAPCFQVVGPRYAEVWFDLKGRATTTMIVAISDPLGTALGQIIAPFIINRRLGILILALITTVALPLSFAVLPKPPKPPTYSGSLISPPIWQTLLKPDNLGGIYAVLVLIASISFILLPVGLELGVEITRNAETSTAVLWSGGNIISFLWVLVMDALRAPQTANPPLNMRKALIFNASFICATACLVIFFTGNQTRRKKDEEMAKRGGRDS
ncbi:hypothetical protein FRC18_002346 [Serendipita sp. 400]|nr:hypothetical protein FRC18_002346 [Serendipita sp. 400]